MKLTKKQREAINWLRRQPSSARSDSTPFSVKVWKNLIAKRIVSYIPPTGQESFGVYQEVQVGDSLDSHISNVWYEHKSTSGYLPLVTLIKTVEMRSGKPQAEVLRRLRLSLTCREKAFGFQFSLEPVSHLPIFIIGGEKVNAVRRMNL
jgi:hypothetical protein